MRKYMLVATAMACAASPALAGAPGPYVGLEGGVTLPQSSDFDVVLDNTSATPPTTKTYDNGYNAKYKTGWNVDAIAGYKFGLFRIEAEGGHQRARIKDLNISSAILNDVAAASGSNRTFLGPLDYMGVTYLTANGLLDSDFGGGFGGYAGAGIGHAWAKFSGDKDNAMAYTGIAGIRYAISPNIDAGVKYQYLRTGKMAFDRDFSANGTNFTSTAKGNYASHNILASLVYNFNSRGEAAAPIPAAAPAPPPPPPAPATQTCPDGTVVLTTSTCPAPPPPPPPPAPAERGERG